MRSISGPLQRLRSQGGGVGGERPSAAMMPRWGSGRRDSRGPTARPPAPHTAPSHPRPQHAWEGPGRRLRPGPGNPMLPRARQARAPRSAAGAVKGAEPSVTGGSARLPHVRLLGPRAMEGAGGPVEKRQPAGKPRREQAESPTARPGEAEGGGRVKIPRSAGRVPPGA